MAGHRSLGWTLLTRRAQPATVASASSSVKPARDSTTRSACERSRRAVTGFGTAMTRKPAARAAVTPCGESSIASAAAGSTPSPAHASRYVAGSGFAASPGPWHAVREHVTQSQAAQVGIDPLDLRAGGDRERKPASLRVRDPLFDARSHDFSSEQSSRSPRRRACSSSTSMSVTPQLEQPDQVDAADRPDLRGPFVHRQRRTPCSSNNAHHARRSASPCRGSARRSRTRLRESLRLLEGLGGVERTREGHPPSAATICPSPSRAWTVATMTSATSAALPSRPSAGAAGHPLAVAG